MKPTVVLYATLLAMMFAMAVARLAEPGVIRLALERFPW